MAGNVGIGSTFELRSEWPDRPQRRADCCNSDSTPRISHATCSIVTNLARKRIPFSKLSLRLSPPSRDQARRGNIEGRVGECRWRATARPAPLRRCRRSPAGRILAWALTIHKSQGQTCVHLYLDLGAGAFLHGVTRKSRTEETSRSARPTRAGGRWAFQAFGKAASGGAAHAL